MQLEKTLTFGKKRLNEIFDIRATIIGLQKKDILGTYDLGTETLQKNVFSREVSELEPSIQEDKQFHSNVQRPLEITKRNTIVKKGNSLNDSDDVDLEFNEKHKKAKTDDGKRGKKNKRRDSVDIFEEEDYISPRIKDERSARSESTEKDYEASPQDKRAVVEEVTPYDQLPNKKSKAKQPQNKIEDDTPSRDKTSNNNTQQVNGISRNRQKKH